MPHRKVTFKLYPHARQAERLMAWIRLHCELYNAALQECIGAYRCAGTDQHAGDGHGNLCRLQGRASRSLRPAKPTLQRRKAFSGGRVHEVRVFVSTSLFEHKNTHLSVKRLAVFKVVVCTRHKNSHLCLPGSIMQCLVA